MHKRIFLVICLFGIIATASFAADRFNFFEERSTQIQQEPLHIKNSASSTEEILINSLSQ